jgi:cell division septation protein DedD
VPSASTSKAPVATATPVTPPEDAPKKPAAGSGAAPVSPAGAASKPDTTGAAATAGGKWGIQVASLSGAARQKGADDLIRRLRETAGLTAQAIPTADGAALRVVVVGFGTREAADTACKELKQKPEFKGAFVKPL